ncbi:unnamed protein product [Mesocestoides corti]|uniref:PDZ domain-containing protein n=2 Tax=Mesocestoides corti TaxID=53468 RepID=A0A0R3ULQ4_MESCO|nr:unnamed protein product [Mesocestoides corti]
MLATCLPRRLHGTPGSPADSFARRIEGLEGSTLAFRAKGPVAVNTHTMRAKRPEEFDRPKTPFRDVARSHLYHYSRDLGIPDEVPRIFLAELRNVYPEGFVRRPVWRDINVYRQPGSIKDLTLKAFPGHKFFICAIKYIEFFKQADIHFSDQVLEISSTWLPEHRKPQITSHAESLDYFCLRILPSPYLCKLELRVYNCAVIDEFAIRKRTLENMRSHRDLGFTIHQGCITHVDQFSPAQVCGFKPDYQIVEVNGQSVVSYVDSLIVRLIRNALGRNVGRRVEVAVIPKRVYDVLMDPRKGKHYNVISNAGFNLEFWTAHKVFGVW